MYKISFSGVGWIVGLFFVASVLAADKPDFNGTWVRETASSDPFTAVLGERSELPDKVDFILKVEQEGKRFIIQVNRDGQESERYLLIEWRKSVPLRFGSKSLSMKFVGSDTLLVHKQEVLTGNFGEMRVDSTQEWVLSQRGNVLTITSTRRETGRPMIVTKEVFERK